MTPLAGPRSASSPWLSPSARERLAARIEAAVVRARRTGRPTLAAVSERISSAVDPAAVVLAARRSGESWAAIEQPDRGGSALAGLGSATTLEAEGPDRFSTVAAQWRDLARGAIADDQDGPSGSGPVAIGGFGFGDRTPSAGPWQGFAAASLVVPEFSIARGDGSSWVTVCAVVAGDDIPEERTSALVSRLDRIATDSMLDTSHAMPSLAPARIASALPPEHYEDAVRRAVEAIRRGEIEKVVLAREVLVEREQDHDPAVVLGLLREVFPSCYLFAVGRGDRSFIGASPELLVRREGLRAATVALAGSTARSADPAVDDHLGERLLRSAKDRHEQAIVVSRIERALNPVSVWVSAPPEPGIAKIANVQHLASPIRAQLLEPVAALDLVDRLHPTPAVGGEPWPGAAAVIASLEGIDRGWYAAPIGWTDTAENGEFCVALRCALLRGPEARCYAGVGVVGDSVAESELAETELKLQAILPAVAG